MKERQIRGMAIISKGTTPQALSKDTYIVSSQSDEKTKYKVNHSQKWTCSCPDFKKKGIWSVNTFMLLNSGLN